MDLSSQCVDRFSPSLFSETLEEQSVISSSLNPNQSSLPSQIETLDSESMGHTPLNPNGSSPISPIMVDSVKTLDGSVSSVHIEAVGEQSLVLQSSNPNQCLPISIVMPESGETLCGYLPTLHVEASGNQILFPSLSNPDGSSVSAPSHVETLDYESVVSSLSNKGGGSSSSSSMDSVDDKCLAPPPRETLHHDGCDVPMPYSPMQVEHDMGPSSPSGLRLLDEDNDEEDNCEKRLVKDEYGQWPASGHPFSNSYYHQNHCDGLHPLHPYHAHRTCKWCGHPRQMCLGSPQWDLPYSNTCGCSKDGRKDRMLPQYPSRETEENSGDTLLGFSFPVQETQFTGVGAGLSNLGNTCFVNAILQCFTHTVPLVKALRSCKHAMPCGNEGFCALCAFRDHIELSLSSSGKTVSPWKFVNNLTNISSCFRRYQQEDAHEFLQCLLDRLERCYLDSNQTDGSSCSQDENIVESVFGGRLISKLQCCNCGHCSYKYEPLIDLSLEIEDVGTLQSALESFTKIEKIEDPETKFTCENCKEEVSREKQLMLDQVPTVAALHLKRFKTDGSSIEKISKHVEFPLELDLKPYTNGSEDSNVDLKYQLYAVVVHNGFFPTSGHYFCYIRSSPGTWHKLDDSVVIEFQEEFVLSQTAYILFYAREGTPWFSSLIESQKFCLDPSISNTSPKSVLDNVDRGTLFPGVEKVDNCKVGVTTDTSAETSTQFSCGTTVEEIRMDETKNENEGISAQISYDSGPNLCCDEFSGDTPFVDVSVPLGASDCHNVLFHNEKVCGVPSAKEDICKLGANKICQNDDLHRPAPPRSTTPDVNIGELPEARYRIPRDHLKVESQVNCKRPSKKVSKGSLDSQRTIALRYVNRNMPIARGMKLMAYVNPTNDNKRPRSSPCKKASLPSRRKLLRVAAMR